MVEWKEVMQKIRRGEKLTEEERAVIKENWRKMMEKKKDGKRRGIYIKARFVYGLQEEEKKKLEKLIIGVVKAYRKAFARE